VKTKTGPLSRLSIEHLWGLVVIVGVFIFVNTHPIRPHDFWWHIAAGRDLARTGYIPTVDMYSQTMPGAPYPAYQTYWLMEWLLYQIYRLGGAPFIVLFQSLMVTATYALTLWLAQRRSGNWRSAAMAALFAAAMGLNDWNVRPQTITFLIAALFLNIIQMYRKHPRAWLLLVFPLGMLVWVNSHGSFPIGLALLGLWGAEEAWRALPTRQWQPVHAPVSALIAAALACLLNPRGIGVVQYVASMTSDPLIQNLVTEWAAPTFDTLGGTLFLGGLLFSAALLALSPKRPTLSTLLAFLAFGALGLKTQRGAVWFGLVLGPALAEHLTHIGVAAHQYISSLGHRPDRDATPSTNPRIQATLNAVMVGIVMLGALSSLPWFKGLWPVSPEKAGLVSAETPVVATEFLLRENLPGPVFHAMSFGSYLIWAAQPQYPVFVDPRIELYPPELWLEYLRISAAAAGWEELLETYGARTLMLSPHEQAGLVTAARESAQWQEVYQDDSSVILVRIGHLSERFTR
jgi:hypothetical protein